MALLAVDRTKLLLHHGRARCSPAGERNEHEVALVPLDVFEVLNEDVFALVVSLLAIELYQLIIGRKESEFLPNQVALVDVDRHDPQRGNFLRLVVSEMPHETNGL